MQAAERRGFPWAASSCLPPAGQKGFPRAFGKGGFETRFRLEVVGPLFFPSLALFLSRFFSEALETSRSAAAPGGAAGLRPAAPVPLPVGSLLLSSPGSRSVPIAGVGSPPATWRGMPVGYPPPGSPSPTGPEPLAEFARRGYKARPAATQRAGRSGDLGPGSGGSQQTEGYLRGRKSVCECDKCLR